MIAIDVFTRDGAMPVLFCDPAAAPAIGGLAPDPAGGVQLLLIQSGGRRSSIALPADAAASIRAAGKVAVLSIAEDGSVRQATTLALGDRAGRGRAIPSEEAERLAKAVADGGFTVTFIR